MAPLVCVFLPYCNTAPTTSFENPLACIRFKACSVRTNVSLIFMRSPFVSVASIARGECSPRAYFYPSILPTRKAVAIQAPRTSPTRGIETPKAVPSTAIPARPSKNIRRSPPFREEIVPHTKGTQVCRTCQAKNSN